MSEGIRKTVKDWLTPALVMLVLTQTVMITRYLQDIENRTLDSTEIKIRVQDLVRYWTLEQQILGAQRLKAVEDSTISLRKSDSLANIERDQIRTTLDQILTILKD